MIVVRQCSSECWCLRVIHRCVGMPLPRRCHPLLPRSGRCRSGPFLRSSFFEAILGCSFRFSASKLLVFSLSRLMSGCLHARCDRGISGPPPGICTFQTRFWGNLVSMVWGAGMKHGEQCHAKSRVREVSSRPSTSLVTDPVASRREFRNLCRKLTGVPHRLRRRL